MRNKIVLIGLVFLLLLSSAFATDFTADNIGWWTLQDSQPLGILDQSTLLENLTSVGSTYDATADAFANYNGDYLTKPEYYDTHNSDWTIGIWVKPESNVVNAGIVSKWGKDGQREFNLGITTASTRFQIGGYSSGYKFLPDTQDFNLSQWYHILAVFDTTANTFELYRDGVSRGTISSGDTENSGLPLHIGTGSRATSASTSPTAQFNGNMSGLTFFDRVLTSTEILELYDEGRDFNPYVPLPPSSPDTLTIQVKDADTASNVNNVTVTWNASDYSNVTGNVVDINITAEGGNITTLKNFTVSSENYFDIEVTNWNISNLYIANITQHPRITAYDNASNATISTFNVSIYDNTFGGLIQTSQTTTGLVYYDCGATATYCEIDVDIYINATNYTDYSNINYRFLANATNDLNASLSPLPLEDFTLLTPNNSLTNASSFNITWTQAVSPTNKVVTYNITTRYVSNSSIANTNTTTALFYLLNLTNFYADDYNVTVTAIENNTGSSQVQSSILSFSATNYLYFYNEQTSDPIVGANITVYFPSLTGSLIYLTDAQGRIDFDSYQNSTIQTGNYNITFEDYDGFVSPLTFARTYNQLPVNESFNITVTNINISIFYRSNFSAFLQNATVTIEGVSSQTVDNGSVFLQNATISNGEYRVTVSAVGFFNEEKTFTFTGQDDLSLNLYMLELNSSNSGTVTIRTIDEFSRLLDDAQVNLLEYDPSTLSYLEVSECFTDSNGECKFLVETNTKSYKFTASRVINGVTVTASTEPEIFADSIVGGETVVFTEETRTLTLSSVDQFQVSPLQNIIFSITPYDESFNNVTNQSNIAVSFNSIDGQSITVCVEYFSVAGGVKTSLTGSTFCLTGSSGEVTENAFFTLNMSKDYVADIYLRTSNGDFNLDSYKYYSNASFLAKLQANGMLPYFVIFIWIFLIGGSMMLKNVSLGGVAIIIGGWVLWAFFPVGMMVSVAVLQTVLGANLVYLGRKREDFG